MDRARRKSYNVAAVEYKQEKFRVDVDKLKKLVAGAAISIALVASILTGVVVKGVDSLQDQMTINEYLSQYSSIVNENTHRTENGKYYWYDTPRMAKEIANNPETLEEELYATYKRIGYNYANKIDQISDVVNCMGYKDFDDYLIQHGHVDEEGQPSRDGYEEYMDASILSKAMMAKAEEGRKK